MGIKTTLAFRENVTQEEFVSIIFKQSEISKQTEKFKNELSVIYDNCKNKYYITIDTDNLTLTSFKFKLTNGFKHIGNYEIMGNIEPDKIKQTLSNLIYKIYQQTNN